MVQQETHTNQNKHKNLLITDNDTEWLSDLIDCLQFFYQMTVKLSGQNYVTCSFIIPCLKSSQVAMKALCENDDDNSEFKIQIASALKRSVNFYIDEFGFFKDSFLMASTFLDPRVRKFKKFKEKESQNAINNAKKYIKSFINDHEIDPIAASTPTPGPTKAKLNIFDFNEMNIDNISLTSLNQEFKDYENINIDFDIDVLDFWRQHEKKFPLLSQVAKRILCVQGASTASERDFSASGYTVWDRRNALLPRKVNMMMILQQFDKNIERLNKLNSQK